MSNKLTAKEVAERAGVSVAAVSRAFRPDSSLSDEKRRAILSVAAELGYQSPGLRLAQSAPERRVTLMTSDLSNPFYPAAIESLSEAFSAAGHQPVLRLVPPDPDPQLLLRGGLPGDIAAVVVLGSTVSSSFSRHLRRHGITAVHYNRILIDRESTAVTCDNYGGARLVAAHFLNRGCKRIGILSGRRNTSTQMERFRGFCDELEARGASLFCDWSGDYCYQTSYQVALAALRQPQRPDALFCANDIMALAVLDVCRLLQIRVPEDLAVIGFDDIPQAAWAPYRLTTIRQPIAQMTRETVDLVLQSLRGATLTGSMRVLPVELVQRDSA